MRKIGLLLSLLVIALLAVIFTYSNPDSITVDIGFVRLEEVSMSLAFAVCFAFGWLFGLFSAGIAVMRIVSERRKLRRNLRLAEAEVTSLRSLPLHDAN
jgi:uncharacterized membrane protein YciS (DUF1049 family)